MNTQTDPLLGQVLLAGMLGLILGGIAYQFGVMRLILPEAYAGLGSSLGQCVGGDDSFVSCAQRSIRSLNDAGHDRYLTLATLVSVPIAGGFVAALRSYSPSLLHALLGWVAGAAAGFVLARWSDLPGAPALLAMPVLAFVGCHLAALCGAPPPRDSSVLRGALVKTCPVTSSVAVKQALKQGATAFGGAVLTPEDEVSHFKVIGVTRVGKSLSIRELLHTVKARGDRAVVADPDGGAMKSFHEPDDTILNPYDERSVRWDLLAEIESVEDYANLAASLLPLSGSKDSEQWEKWARDIFVTCLRYWHENDVGTSDEFTTMLASASNDKLALLCEGMEAARVFKPGMEKMLGSILQTLSEVIKDLRLVASGPGRPFSVRQWVREGQGTLWMPYMAKQIPSLRRLVSVWMSLAVTEPMSMGESDTRRLWFIVDELDALGPIDRLDEALVRGGKFGICVVLGFQTIAQVQGAYGNTVATDIVENCSTMLFLRCNQSMGGGTAKFASDCIGDNETRRVETSSTRTEGGHPSSSLSTNTRQQVQTAVLPSEIARLPKRQGYLTTQSDPDWCRTKIDITTYPQVTLPFVPAKWMSRVRRGSDGATS